MQIGESGIQSGKSERHNGINGDFLSFGHRTGDGFSGEKELIPRPKYWRPHNSVTTFQSAPGFRFLKTRGKGENGLIASPPPKIPASIISRPHIVFSCVAPPGLPGWLFFFCFPLFG